MTRASAPALAHARHVIRLEKWLGVWLEPRLHRAVASRPAVLHAFNVYYGTVHFVVPVVALAVLWRTRPADYRRWRNVFGWMLVLGLVFFAVYPVTPPHLLPASFGFGTPDSMPRAPFWSWAADNPYAAMPSLHVGWSSWCVAALWRSVPDRRWRAALVAYPLLTLLVVAGTANHYLLDGAGGLLVLGAAYGIEEARRRRLGRRAPTPSDQVL